MKHRSEPGSGVPALVLTALGLLLAHEVFADSMRCGQKVVRTGDSQAALLERCGEPRHKSRAHTHIKTENGRKEVRVEQWHYKRSDRSLERIVMIYRGEVVRVETGGR